MLKNSENSPASAPNLGVLAVLFLSSPSASESPVDWFWKRLAGVPILLRNILNIQRGGVQRLALFVGNDPMAGAELHRRISQDPRVTLKLEWFSESQKLIQHTNEISELLFLEGSAAYDKAQIKSVLVKTPVSGDEGELRSFFVDRNSLNSLLESMDTFNFSRLEQAREQSLNSKAQNHGGEKKSLVYFAEANPPKISSEGDFYLESERIIHRSGGLSNDSLATRILSRPVSKLITRLLVNTRVTPNQITGLSFVLGLGSAVSFFQGGYQMGLIGAGLLLLSIWVDGVDGEIARIKFMETELGGKLDIYCDNIVHVAVFFSIGMGLFNTLGDKVYAVLGGFAAIGSLISFLMLGAAITAGKSQASSADDTNRKKNGFIDKLANRDFTHFLFVLALLGRLDVFIWLTAVGVNFLALYLLFSRRKSTPPKTGA